MYFEVHSVLRTKFRRKNPSDIPLSRLMSRLYPSVGFLIFQY